jgi:hypothetical protein
MTEIGLANQTAKNVAIAFGALFLVASIVLPIVFWMMREHGGEGISALFTPGAGSLSEALGAAFTTAGIISSIVVAIAVLPLEGQRSQKAKLLGVVTLAFVSCELLYLLSLSWIRPLTGTAPNILALFYVMGGLIPLGLALTMFTIAAIV